MKKRHAKAKCGRCGCVVESTGGFVQCPCDAIAVDVGTTEVRFLGDSEHLLNPQTGAPLFPESKP